jgi:hypothetical protein
VRADSRSVLPQRARHDRCSGYRAGMRTALVALLLLAASPCSAEMSKADCQKMASMLDALMQASLKVQKTLNSFELDKMTATASKDVRTVAGPAESARIRLVLALGDFAGFSETLVSELRGCAIR